MMKKQEVLLLTEMPVLKKKAFSERETVVREGMAAYEKKRKRTLSRVV